MRPKILLCCIGSLGDLYPFLAIAVALKARGARPVIATTANHAKVARDAGLDAIAIYPELFDMLDFRGLTAEQTMAWAREDGAFVFDFIAPYTLEAARALYPHASDASLMAGNALAMAGEIVAQKAGIPFVPVALQPMTTLNPHDPPLRPRTVPFFDSPNAGPALWWNKALLAFATHTFKRRLGPPINTARAAAGLGPLKNAPIVRFEPGHPLMLCLYSPLFSSKTPTGYGEALVTGAPFFDPPSAVDSVDHALMAFLDAGPDPLVFTLGSAAVFAPGSFYREAVQLAQGAGCRAVLVGAPADVAEGYDDIIAVPYAPHAAVFPRAAANIHQGGIGTLSRAIAAGRPQLIIPHGFDQFDNAERARRMGVAQTIDVDDFTAERAAPLLQSALTSRAMQASAKAAADAINAERGAEVAAQKILEVVAPRRKRSDA